MPDISTRYWIEEFKIVQEDIKKEIQSHNKNNKDIVEKYVKKSIEGVFTRLGNGTLKTFQGRKVLEKLELLYMYKYPHEKNMINQLFEEALGRLNFRNERVYFDLER